MPEACKSPRKSDCSDCAMRNLMNGGRINLVRLNLGLTIKEYADLCGVPDKTMERILLGANPPSGITLLKIIKRGKVNPGILEVDGWEDA